MTFAEAHKKDEWHDEGDKSFSGKVSNFIKSRPYFLITAAICSVVGCCFMSQILLKFSK